MIAGITAVIGLVASDVSAVISYSELVGRQWQVVEKQVYTGDLGVIRPTETIDMRRFEFDWKECRIWIMVDGKLESQKAKVEIVPSRTYPGFTVIDKDRSVLFRFIFKSKRTGEKLLALSLNDRPPTGFDTAKDFICTFLCKVK